MYSTESTRTGRAVLAGALRSVVVRFCANVAGILNAKAQGRKGAKENWGGAPDLNRRLHDHLADFVLGHPIAPCVLAPLRLCVESKNLPRPVISGGPTVPVPVWFRLRRVVARAKITSAFGRKSINSNCVALHRNMLDMPLSRALSQLRLCTLGVGTYSCANPKVARMAGRVSPYPTGYT